jgi:hypothetical protein
MLSGHATLRIPYLCPNHLLRFDVLNSAGSDLTDQPLAERRGHLPAIINKPSRLAISHNLPGAVADIVGIIPAAGAVPSR